MSGLSLTRQPPLGASTLHPQGMSRRQAAGHAGMEPAFCAHAAQEHKRVIITQAAQHTGSGSPVQGASPGAQTGLPKPWGTPEAGAPASPMTIMPHPWVRDSRVWGCPPRSIGCQPRGTYSRTCFTRRQSVQRAPLRQPTSPSAHPQPRASFNYYRSIEGWTSRPGVGGSRLSTKPGSREQLITPTDQEN